MSQKIKVYLNSGGHSKGRGVGFYAENLQKALTGLNDIELTSSDPDIVHYPFFDLFYSTLPLIKNKPTIVTIHDLTPLAMSDRYPRGLKGNLNLLHQRLSLTNVKAVITDSQYSKGDIVKIFGLDFEKVFVTPLAVDELYKNTYSKSKLEEIKKKYQLPDKFVLVVPGGPNPNKNLPALAEVTKQINVPLVVVGKSMLQNLTEPVHPELTDLLALKKYSHVVYPGFVPTDELVGIYQLASVYAQSSLYEGFGLPLLEAMTTGCLVVSSNSTSLPEIYHRDAITFDPRNLTEFKAALEKALSLSPKEKAFQIEEAQKRSEDFSWQKTAMETARVYHQVYES